MVEREDRFRLVGTVVDGKYLVEKVVGEGGFGIVYRAYHQVFRRPVALKCLVGLEKVKPEFRDQLIEQFVSEGALLTELSSQTSNIVQARDISSLTSPTGDWLPYLVLEWLDGATLAEWLCDKGGNPCAPLRTASQCVALMSGPAKALALTHQHGIAHRDLKPANLMVVGDKLAPGAMIKILDFGIAKVMQSHTTSALQATGGALTAFTLRYGAPEQWDRGAFGATGPWTDVYQMALIFVEIMRGGAHALTGDSAPQLMFSTTHPDKRPTPRFHHLNVSDAVEDVFRKALAIDIAVRYSNMGEFWTALELAVQQADDALLPTLPRPTPPRPTPPRPAPPPAPVPTPTSQSTSKSSFTVVLGVLLGLAGIGVVLYLSRTPPTLPGVEDSTIVSPFDPDIVISARRRLGDKATRQALISLERVLDAPKQDPTAAVRARLAQAEIILLNTLSRRIALVLGATEHDLSSAINTDLADAEALIGDSSEDGEPAQVKRIRALLTLAQEKSDLGALANLDEDIASLVLASPLWRIPDAPVTSQLVESLRRVQDSTSLHESLLALALWRTGDMESARAILGEVLARADDMDAARAIQRAMTESAKPKPGSTTSADPGVEPKPPTPTQAPAPVTPAMLVQSGCQKVRNGKATEGLKLLRKALSDPSFDHGDLDLCMCFGEGFTSLREYNTALTWYRRALERSPRNRDALSGAAQAAESMRKKEDALALYRRLLEVDPKNEHAQSYVTGSEQVPSVSSDEIRSRVQPLWAKEEVACKATLFDFRETFTVRVSSQGKTSVSLGDPTNSAYECVSRFVREAEKTRFPSTKSGGTYQFTVKFD